MEGFSAPKVKLSPTDEPSIEMTAQDKTEAAAERLTAMYSERMNAENIAKMVTEHLSFTDPRERELNSPAYL